MGVSVSKKFQKAVDRDYFKRVLRETYRLNKHLLAQLKPHSFMFSIKPKTFVILEINSKQFNFLRVYCSKHSQKNLQTNKIPQ
jgi:ribonuclease P protein component